MNHNKISVRYTKALYELAKEQGNLEKVYADILLISKLFQTQDDFTVLADNPIISASKKAEVFTAVLKPHVQEITMNFVLLVVTNKRENYLEHICMHFAEKYRLEKGIKLVSISSSAKLEDATKKKLTNLIAQTEGVKEVVLDEKLDPELIGGFVVKVDDIQLDASVISKLNKIKRGLLNTSI